MADDSLSSSTLALKLLLSPTTQQTLHCFSSNVNTSLSPGSHDNFVEADCFCLSVCLCAVYHRNFLDESQDGKYYQFSFLQLMRGSTTNCLKTHNQSAFYPRDAMLARVIAIATCLSVHLSVTRRYCVKTKKASGMISSPSGSPKTLLFWHQTSSPNSKGFPPNGGLK